MESGLAALQRRDAEWIESHLERLLSVIKNNSF